MNITDIDHAEFDHSSYFLTPDLSQRLDLVSHLLANTDLIPFIYASEGSGKTRLARYFADILSAQYTVSLISGDSVSSINDLKKLLAEVLGLAEGSEISEALLEEQLCQLAERNKSFLLLLDDADQLAADCLAWITDFFNDQKSACNSKCVIFSAVDVLALPLAPLSLGQLKERIQILDIPNFTLEQTREFVNFIRNQGEAPFSDAQYFSLQKETEGIPGKVLWQVQFIQLQLRERSTETSKSEPWLKPLVVLATIGFLSIAGAVIYYQDEINLYIADEEDEPVENVELKTLVIPTQEKMPLVMIEEEVINEQIDTLVKDESIDDSFLATESDAVETKKEDEEFSQNIQNIEHILPVKDAIESVVPPKPEEIELEATFEIEKVIAKEAIVEKKQSPESPVSIGPSKKVEIEDKILSQKNLTVVAEEKVVIEKPKKQTLMDKLVAAAKGSYTLQLLAVSEKEGLIKFINRHKIQDETYILETDRKGKPWFALLYGVYPTKEAAVVARSKLPKSYKSSSAWPRPVEPIQKSLL